MAGGTNVHSRISSRVLVSLGKQLDDSDCEAYNSDTKVRAQIQSRTYFYYPDVSVVCDSNSDDETFQDQPVVIVEVVSDSTRRVDEGEKREHYLSIKSLQVYVLLEQSQAAATVITRDDSGQFVEAIYQDPDSVISITSLGLELRFDEIYAGIELLN